MNDMWSSQFFWKFLLASAGINCLVIIIFSSFLMRYSEKLLVEESNNRLGSAIAFLGLDLDKKLETQDKKQLQRAVRSWSDKLDLRITVLAPNGEVIADSFFHDPAQFRDTENHKDRVEIIQAAANGQGSSQRVSATVGSSLRYLAIRVGSKTDPMGFVRVAIPTERLNAAVSEKRKNIIWGAVATGAIVLGVSIWFGGRTVGAVKLIDAAVQKIAFNSPPAKVYLPDRDEFGTLGDHLNRMSVDLSRQINQLQEAQTRLATVLEGMGEGVITVDYEEQILFANSAAGELLNFDPQEAVSRPLLEAVRNHTLHEAVAQAIAGQNPGRREIEIGENHDRILGASFKQMQGDPCPGIVIVLNDFTDLRRLELLRQEFIANVSHELKTPLAAIKAYAETLQRGALDDGVNRKRFVERIEEQAERLHQLILDMLQLARVESGKQAFDIHAISVSETVKSCIDDFLDPTQSQTITLTYDPPHEDLFVQADAEALRHILNNLIDNAVKYTPKNGSITVRWRREHEMVVIDVVDTGIGIAAKDQDRLFERFFRVDKARSQELGGTGLGLSIVKHLALNFGGQVGVTSRLGMGSTFTVRLPLAKHDHPTKPSHPASQPVEG